MPAIETLNSACQRPPYNAGAFKGLFVPVLFCLLLVSAQGQHARGAVDALSRFRNDRILIKAKSGSAPADMARLHIREKTAVLRRFQALGDLQVLSVPAGDVTALIERYKRSGLVEFAEPDYWVSLASSHPDEPAYSDGTLWALHNTGQNGGVADADIDAPEAWSTANSATGIVVAVIDTGVRYTHEDLASNMWSNPLDGTHGFNAFDSSHDPNDDSGHGTLVAGILGAAGNNGTGVTGVAWQTRIMACKFAGHQGGSVSDAIACIDFARTNGARIINASWGAYDFPHALSNAISAAREADIIVVAAAGNDMPDIDLYPFYPASFEIDNVISVAATTRRDELYARSNYGATNVDLGAPGFEIYSTYHRTDNDYRVTEGTSMAAAFVTGACALLRSRYPAETAQQIIGRLLAGTDPLPSLAGRCVTGGRLNLRKALGQSETLPARLAVVANNGAEVFQLRLSGDTNRCYMMQATTDFVSWTTLSTNVTDSDGTFLFTPGAAENFLHRFFRAVAAP